MTSQGAGPRTPSNPKRPPKMASSQSLNHLLNFTLPPRQTHQYQAVTRRKKTGNQQGVWNKERFVNAQYRFIMNPSGDYTVHFADPDIFFQWQDILQVIIPRVSALVAASGPTDQAAQEESNTTCPICLSPPTAPRMTKCGHVFCFPCILHLLGTSDNLKWVRCPICFDSVNERQLKAVKWFEGVPFSDNEDEAPPRASSSTTALDSGLVSAPRPGTELRMRLMQRPQITTLALPRSQTWPSDLLPPHQAPFHFLPDVYPFAKFMLATPASLVQDLTRDIEDLATERRILSSMNDDLGVTFVDAAETRVMSQIAKANALETPTIKDAIDTAQHIQQQLDDRAAHDASRRRDERASDAPLPDAPEEYLATQSSGYSTPTLPQIATSLSTNPSSQPTPTPTRTPRQRKNLNPPPPSTSSYYYYQAASGMPIFLHPLDIKILLSNFNSYAAFPDTITVRIESSTESTVNEDLRKRCKYLAHFPEGADVVFVETDLTDVVGADGLKNFERALTMRRNRRKEKGRKDDRARAKAEEREKEKLVENWNQMARRHVDSSIPTSYHPHSQPMAPAGYSHPHSYHAPPSSGNSNNNDYGSGGGRVHWGSNDDFGPYHNPEVDEENTNAVQTSQQLSNVNVNISNTNSASGNGNGNRNVSSVGTGAGAGGAWGARSFASAAHAAQGRPLSTRPPVPTTTRRNNPSFVERVEDEWDLDAAFHELEQRSGGGRGKRKNNRLVVLGSGGGGRRR